MISKAAFAPDINLHLLAHRTRIVNSFIILKAIRSANTEKDDPHVLSAYYAPQGNNISHLFHWENLTRDIEREDRSVTSPECMLKKHEDWDYH